MSSVWNFDVSQDAEMFRVSISRSGGDRPFNLFRSCATMQEVIEVIRSSSGLIDVNAADKRGRTAMYVACERGYHDLAEVLLDMGADVNVLRTGGHSGSHVGYTALHAVARGGMVDAAKLLLRRGAKADLFSPNGYMPLHLACKYGHRLVAAEILHAGADVNARSAERVMLTALHIASEKGDEQMVELLLRRKADVHAVDRWGNTALHECFPGVAQLLLRNGANPWARNFGGMTPLHEAAARDQVETVRLLLDCGVDTNTRDYFNGMTPLHWACRKKSTNAARYFLKMGAGVNDVTVNSNTGSGLTALHLATNPQANAAPRCYAKLFKLLFDWGADVNARDCHGRTALVLLLEFRSHNILRSAVVEDFTKQLATMRALGLHVSETNLQAISDHEIVRNLSRACETELQSMRSQKIGDSSVTFFDLLTKGPLRLADYAANADVVRVLKSGKFKKEFPRFAEDIRQNFVDGKKRLRLQRESDSVLRRGSFRFAPYNVMRRLDRYLTNGDLNQIIKAKD